MRKLNELIDRVGKITLEDTFFGYLQEFFSDRDVQEKMVRLNQKQMFDDSSNREGNGLGDYAPYTIQRKQFEGLPYPYFTFYESGSFYASMGVSAGEDSVAITSDTNGIGVDYGMEDFPEVVEMSHINNMFEKYDPNRKALGLTDDNFAKFVEESDMKGRILERLKQFING